MKKILIINPGSTSTKYKVFDKKGNVLNEQVFSLEQKKQELIFLNKLENVEKIGIRVVHGGDITKTSKINKTLKNKIKDYLDFAPIHNDRALKTIEKIEKIFPKIPFFASFDTAFHTSIPLENSTYMIDQKLAQKYGLKKYGFHGLAVQSAFQKVKDEAKKKNKKMPKKIIFAHLGGGCSITAVKNGKSFATSMELTPLSGVPMITRSGSVDPDIFSILLKRSKMSVEKISEFLNKKSGFYGMTGIKDTLKIMNSAQKGKKKEKLAFDIFVNEIVKKIFAYTGLMRGVDAIVFSGGIGFGNSFLRKNVLKKVKILGISQKDVYVVDIDEEKIILSEL
jgi:acetate kinase